MGCPHAPTVRRVVTDASGRTRLEAMPNADDFRLWIHAQNIRCEPVDLGHLTVATGGRFRVVTAPDLSVPGKVVDEKGRAVPGVVIRALRWGRGPFAVTDEAGSFVLPGPEGAALGVFPPDRPFADRPACVVRSYDPEIPLRITLRKDRPTVPANGEPRHLVEVIPTARAAPGKTGEHLGGIPIRITRIRDGLTFRGRSGGYIDAGESMGLARFSVPAGRYSIVVGGGWSDRNPVSFEIDLPIPDGSPLRPTLGDRRPGVRFPLGESGAAAVERFHLPGLSRSRGSVFSAPATGPLAAVRTDPVPRVLTAPESDGGAREFRVPYIKPTRVRFRVEGEEPSEDVQFRLAPRFGRGDEELENPADHYTFRTWCAGPAVLHVFDEDIADPRHEFVLPTEPGTEVDLGVIRLVRSVERTIRVRLPDGRSPEHASLDLLEREEMVLSYEGIPSASGPGEFEITCGVRPRIYLLAMDPEYRPGWTL